MSFYQKLKNIWAKHNSLACVGLDSDINKLPKHLLSTKYPIFEFNKAIIEATHDLVCAFKLQIAYYNAVGAENQLEMTAEYIRNNCPDACLILDSKRNDVSSTAEMYVKEAFERYQVDALTVNPYMGLDSVEPFLAHKDKGIMVLCRTSNPGAKDIQDLEVDGKKLYQVVANMVASKWNYNNNVSLVVGATYPKELKEIRSMVGDMPFLMPGVGTQGGSIEAAVTNGMDSRGTGMIINSSRGIIYASNGEDFAQAAGKATEELRSQINQHRKISK